MVNMYLNAKNSHSIFDFSVDSFHDACVYQRLLHAQSCVRMCYFVPMTLSGILLNALLFGRPKRNWASEGEVAGCNLPLLI